MHIADMHARKYAGDEGPVAGRGERVNKALGSIGAVLEFRFDRP
jgi:hypothetical protein